MNMIFLHCSKAPSWPRTFNSIFHIHIYWTYMCSGSCNWCHQILLRLINIYHFPCSIEWKISILIASGNCGSGSKLQRCFPMCLVACYARKRKSTVMTFFLSKLVLQRALSAPRRCWTLAPFRAVAFWLILLVCECFVGVGGGCPLSGWLPLVKVLKFILIWRYLSYLASRIGRQCWPRCPRQSRNCTRHCLNWSKWGSCWRSALFTVDWVWPCLS